MKFLRKSDEYKQILDYAKSISVKQNKLITCDTLRLHHYMQTELNIEDRHIRKARITTLIRLGYFVRINMGIVELTKKLWPPKFTRENPYV